MSEKLINIIAVTGLMANVRLHFYCLFEFSSLLNFSIPFQVPFTCYVCGKGYIDKHKLKVHLQYHSDYRGFECKYCGKKFKTNSNQKKHEKDIHENGGVASTEHFCDECGRVFKCKDYLVRHKLVHEEQRQRERGVRELPWLCGACGKHYTNRHNARNHIMRTHKFADFSEYVGKFGPIRQVKPEEVAHENVNYVPRLAYPDSYDPNTTEKRGGRLEIHIPH